MKNTNIYIVNLVINGELNETEHTDKQQALNEAHDIFNNLSPYSRRHLDDLYIMEYDFDNKTIDIVKDYLA